MPGGFETVTTAVSDTWPVCREHKPALVAATAAVMMICGLPFCSKGEYSETVKTASTFLVSCNLKYYIDCTLVL